MTLPNGIRTNYKYDNTHRLVQLIHKNSVNEILAQYDYTLGVNGRRVAAVEQKVINGSTATTNINYQYDNLYRLVREGWSGENTFEATYSYDKSSNRLQKTLIADGQIETINYSYNANDQLTEENSNVNGITNYAYDENGSLISKVNEEKFNYQYEYNIRNRLIAANVSRKENDRNISIIASYSYDVHGLRNRVQQTIDGITNNRYFVLDPGHTGYNQVLEETSELGGSPVRSYVLGDDVLSQTVSGVTSYFLYDGHGSTRQLANVAGLVHEGYSYDAYGIMLGGNPNVTDRLTSTDLLYSGEQFDAGLQMEYLRARYYDQNVGRFNRQDPFAGDTDDPQSLHKYAYTHCDPVNSIDPAGFMSLGEILNVQAIMSKMRTSFSVAAGKVFAVGLKTVALRMLSGAFVGGTLNAFDTYLGDPENWTIERYVESFLWGAALGAGFAFAGPAIPIPLIMCATTFTTFFGTTQSFMNGQWKQGFYRLSIGIVSLGLLGKLNSINKLPKEDGLVHMTKYKAAIEESGVLGGKGGQPGDIYAAPANMMHETGFGLTIRAALTPNGTYQAVQIPTAATGAFSRPKPIGFATLWQYVFGTQTAPRGTVNLSTGEFSKAGANLTQLKWYSFDVGLDVALMGYLYLQTINNESGDE